MTFPIIINASGNDLTGWTLVEECGCEAVCQNEIGSKWTVSICEDCSNEEIRHVDHSRRLKQKRKARLAKRKAQRAARKQSRKRR